MTEDEIPPMRCVCIPGFAHHEMHPYRLAQDKRRRWRKVRYSWEPWMRISKVIPAGRRGHRR